MDNDNGSVMCCSKTNKNFLKYLFTCVILLIVLLFSIIQVAMRNDTTNNAVYFSLISSIISIFIPPPHMDQHPQNQQPSIV